MKKNFFPVALMALAIGFNACSSDDVTVNANGGVSSPVLEGGYVKMAINMPSQVSGRALKKDPVKDNGDQVTFEDGLAKEFDVKNATLLLFAGSDKTTDATEDDAIFHSAYKLDVSMAKEGAQITSTTRIVKPVNDAAYKDKDKLYAYVLLNNNGLVTVNGETDVTLTLKNSANVTATLLSTTKFGDFRKYVAAGGASAFHADAKGFLMNNAPLYNGSNVQTLVPIDSVYKTKEAAEAADAREVFVERALAKVTMHSEVTNSTLSAKDAVIVKSDTDGDLNKTFSIEGWTLDVTNKTSYLGRSFNSTWGETDYGRFFGTTKLRENGKEHEGTSLYRTYWGEDPNYASSVVGDFNILTKDAAYKAENPEPPKKPVNLVSNGFGNYNPLYCMENTFNVAEMATGSQVTRAIVKVKFLNGTTFYTFNDDNTTLYTQAKMIERVKQAILDNTAVFNKCKDIFGEKKLDQSNVTITWKSADEAGVPKRDEDGKIYLKSFKISDGTSNPDGTPKKVESSDVFGTSTTNLNGKSELQFGNIMQYAGGLAYYAIPIKHFGDKLTPWDKTTAIVGKPYGDPINEASEKSYLGRYGVLRNNWYDLAVSGIKYVGSPVVPETVTPDKAENYIAVRINVLSWAKRTQVEEL